MNKQQTLSNTTHTATPVPYETDQSSDNLSALLDRAPEKFITEAKSDDGPVHFKNANDVKKFMTETGQVPVVRKRRGKPRSDRIHHPVDDYFELVESFPTYEHAQQLIDGKLIVRKGIIRRQGLLIWSVPITTSPKSKTRTRRAT